MTKTVTGASEKVNEWNIISQTIAPSVKLRCNKDTDLLSNQTLLKK